MKNSTKKLSIHKITPVKSSLKNKADKTKQTAKEKVSMIFRSVFSENRGKMDERTCDGTGIRKFYENNSENYDKSQQTNNKKRILCCYSKPSNYMASGTTITRPSMHLSTFV